MPASAICTAPPCAPRSQPQAARGFVPCGPGPLSLSATPTGPVHSMGLVMVDRVSWNVADLRVDWTEGDPIEECAALWERWRGEMDAYVTRALNPSGAPSYGVPGDL